MANTTDKSILTAAGKALLAQLNAEEKALIIDKMIFANVPNRPEFPQPDDVVPTDHVVHQEGVEQRGRLSADSVIYSTTLTSDVGPFEFNWTGAYCSEYGVLVTIDHHALTPKSADEPGIAGNTLVRSVVLEYKGIAEITNITVDASSWQYNATPRMKKMDDDVAQAIIDQNGKDWFIEDGFLVTPQASAFNIKAGAGYVSGNRVTLEFDRNVQVPNKPSFIYVDAHREGTPTGEQVTLFDFVVTAEEKDDYTDENGVKHFVCKIAQVLVDGSVVDLRPKSLTNQRWESGKVVTSSRDKFIYQGPDEDADGETWYAPDASQSNPVVMGETPTGDNNFVRKSAISELGMMPLYSAKVGRVLTKKHDSIELRGRIYPLSKRVDGEIVEINLISTNPYLTTDSETVYLLDIEYWNKDKMNIRAWWATGRGADGVDDTGPFQTFFGEVAKGADGTAEGRSVFSVYLPNPSSFYKITDTIELDGIHGLKVYGDGALTQRSGLANPENPAEEACIRWYGSDSKPLFALIGNTQSVSNPNFYLNFEDLTLSGYRENLKRDGSPLPDDLSLCGILMGNYIGVGQKTLNRQVHFKNVSFANFRFGSGSISYLGFNTDHARIVYDTCYFKNNAQAGLIWGSGNAIATVINPFFEGNGWGADQFPEDDYSPQVGANLFCRSGTVDIYSYTSTGHSDHKPKSADIYQQFGQVNICNAWSDTHGYFLYQDGGGTSYPGAISGVRHYEASMTVANTPDSMRLRIPGTTVKSCAMYGNMVLDSGFSNRPVCEGITFLRASATYIGSAVNDQRSLIVHGNAGNAAQSLWGGANLGVELSHLGVLTPQHLHMGVHEAGALQLYATRQIRGAADSDASCTEFFDAATGATITIVNGYLSSLSPMTVTPTRIGNVYYLTEGQGEAATMRQAYSDDGRTPILVSNFKIVFDIRSGPGVYGNQTVMVPPNAPSDPSYSSSDYWLGGFYFNTTTLTWRGNRGGDDWVDMVIPT